MQTLSLKIAARVKCQNSLVIQVCKNMSCFYYYSLFSFAFFLREFFSRALLSERLEQAIIAIAHQYTIICKGGK